MNRQILISSVSAVMSASIFVERMSAGSIGWGLFWAVLAVTHYWLFLEEIRRSQRPFWIGFYDGISLGPVRRLIERLMK